MFKSYLINEQLLRSLYTKIDALIELLIRFGQKQNLILKRGVRCNNLNINITAPRLIIEARTKQPQGRIFTKVLL